MPVESPGPDKDYESLETDKYKGKNLKEKGKLLFIILKILNIKLLDFCSLSTLIIEFKS